jgi:superfamily II DNA or RNA helicase
VSGFITLSVGNQQTRVEGADKRVLKLLDEATMYKVEGYFFSWAYKTRRWDGAEHLLKQRANGVTFPTGLLDDVLAALHSYHCEVKVDDRRVSTLGLVYEWNDDIKPRKYQARAISSFMKHGFGILKMPIRSGKTKTAAKIIHLIQQRTVFIVPSKTLFHQTIASLQECFPKERIGQIGGGKWDVQNINVATTQSLVSARSRKKPHYKELIERMGFIIFDECHHLTGKAWCQVMMDFKGRYRLGLSATPLLESRKEVAKGVIWLKASCGPIRADVNMSEMIEQGWLVRPTFKLYRIDTPEGYTKRGWSKGLMDKLIFFNDDRNERIAQLAREYARAGKRVLIVTRRLEQVDLLHNKLPNSGYIIGEVTQAERERRMREFTRGATPIMIGSIFKEGVDVPEIDVLINAEGGYDDKMTIQRLRNLTPFENKTEAVVIDFMDMTNKFFAKHSRARLKVYRSEPAFRIELQWAV